MGIKTQNIRIIKKNPGGQNNGLFKINTSETDRTELDATVSENSAFLLKENINKGLRKFDFIPVDSIEAAFNNFKALKKSSSRSNPIPLRKTYEYVKPDDDTRQMIRTLHYNLRHYDGKKSKNIFPAYFNFETRDALYRISIEEHAYEGSNPGIGHRITLRDMNSDKTLARCLFYRFGDIRVDFMEEENKGKICYTSEGIKLLNAFFRYQYTPNSSIIWKS